MYEYELFNTVGDSLALAPPLNLDVTLKTIYLASLSWFCYRGLKQKHTMLKGLGSRNWSKVTRKSVSPKPHLNRNNL